MQLKIKWAQMFRHRKNATDSQTIDGLLNVSREMFIRIISGEADELEVQKMLLGDAASGDKLSNYGNINLHIDTLYKGKSPFLKDFYTGADSYDPAK